VRVAVAHPLLLRGGVLADRQPPARPERLVIVIDEHGLAVLVSGQAVEVVYGMNFIRMPELEWHFGYPAVLGLMALTGVLFIVFFRRRGWL